MDESLLLDCEMSPSNKRQKKRNVITVRVGNDRVIRVDQEDYRAFCKLSPGIFPNISFTDDDGSHDIIGMYPCEEPRIFALGPWGPGFSFGGRIPDDLWRLSALAFLNLSNTSTGPIPSSIQSL